jgi:hypothetical protein
LTGTMMDFILNGRLGWSKEDLPAFSQAMTPFSSLNSSSASSVRSFQMDRSLFENKSEWKILRNDWPYGIDSRIVHLVVWTKFSFTEDIETGDLTTEMHRMIEDFVQETFRKTLGFENVSDYPCRGMLLTRLIGCLVQELEKPKKHPIH